jgi:hypothetical protein
MKYFIKNMKICSLMPPMGAPVWEHAHKSISTYAPKMMTGKILDGSFWRRWHTFLNFYSRAPTPAALIRSFCITILYHNLLLFIDIFYI